MKEVEGLGEGGEAGGFLLIGGVLFNPMARLEERRLPAAGNLANLERGN